MQCPRCPYEAVDHVLSTPCPQCGYEWHDTYSYVKWLADPEERIRSVLDIGCGLKGVIAQHYWENVRSDCVEGFACDRHVVKELPSLWTPLVVDAELLADRLGTNGVDFTTHCGMLEHIEYDKALRIMHVVELVTAKKIFCTMSTVMREVDYKVKLDGNPHHYYRSFWDIDTLEALGYTVDFERMKNGKTFSVELTCWMDARRARNDWSHRRDAAVAALCSRRCYIEGCPYEPFGWSPFIGERGACFCLYHGIGDATGSEDPDSVLMGWLESDKLGEFQVPPWRKDGFRGVHPDLLKE